jgi:pilus assembly protein Flp/PilA
MKKFINDESGATAIEYGLIAAAMGLMLVLVMPILATAVSGVFRELASGLENAGT